MDESSEVLTIEQTAALLGIEKHHVTKLIRAGMIPAVRLSPRIIRIPRALLMERLESLAAGG